MRLLTTPRYLIGGASVDGYENFNLATHTGDSLDAVMHNRKLLVQRFNLPSMPKWLSQTHSNICLDANSHDCEGDAIVTRKKVWFVR
ncbi:MAG: laccase domain-containing protein [Candidatus Thiodubiliella endoseptemdiera]|uniref:Laccase domain-containing protein n=1 Tax=Candidatus Thiodubiliella endoseptemdiera TaxID=2738886 RepID=A0A853F3T5_9GAMM|nr:laccase domain-containing protein [Candidatus Thiodubiliella endoseptemdiera]